ncbi:aminotransferase, classes I and II family protein [Naegleria gruberi]|uniref:serine C-palmitoyltransferase n=2 Tax=Naegleria gruberi TaxID=5762 RepID=D2W1X2_NAEGR|nr:aminotransferase, classes I and II family protein [Naegleria gruberi]EFC36940.1 aminotransferase, classes I and II family protein [Naegleria gruberi]|eukprot:XP_002669684.1 aminotransferase, classes I and II family protein [Naegleria gruberi strain NEG-M]
MSTQEATSTLSAMESLSRYVNIFNKLADILVGEFQNHPYRSLIDVSIIVLIVWYLMSKRRSAVPPQKLSKKQEDEIIEDWEPVPLVPTSDDSNVDATINAMKEHEYVVTSVADVEFTVEGKKDKVINFGTNNFLGFIGDKDIHEKCKDTVREYGVGSCGPRGFYGTIDVHLDFEKLCAKFMGTEACILYSFGFCTVSSVIPAFSKREDVILCDEACNYAIKTGCHLARSTVGYFKHNNVKALEDMMKEIVANDNGATPKNRRFIVVEGVYENNGDIANLKEIIALKKKYVGFRIILDDSYGVGVLGKTGRGTIEHFGLDINDFEIVCVNMENSFGSVGGVCVGSNIIVDHQRLSGAGYCFSASLPPYLSTAAIEAMNKLDTNPDSYLVPLQKNVTLLSETLNKKISFKNSKLVLLHEDKCPIFHIRLADDHPAKAALLEAKKQVDQFKSKKNKKQMAQASILFYEERNKVQQKFKDIVSKAIDQGVAVVCPNYTHREITLPEPGLRLSVSSKHTKQHLEKCADVLSSLFAEILPSKM